MSPNDMVHVDACFHKPPQSEVTKIISSQASNDADLPAEHRQLNRSVRCRAAANANVIVGPMFFVLRWPSIRDENEIDIYSADADYHLSHLCAAPKELANEALPFLMLRRSSFPFKAWFAVLLMWLRSESEGFFRHPDHSAGNSWPAAAGADPLTVTGSSHERRRRVLLAPSRATDLIAMRCSTETIIWSPPLHASDAAARRGVEDDERC